MLKCITLSDVICKSATNYNDKIWLSVSTRILMYLLLLLSVSCNNRHELYLKYVFFFLIIEVLSLDE